MRKANPYYTDSRTKRSQQKQENCKNIIRKKLQNKIRAK